MSLNTGRFFFIFAIITKYTQSSEDVCGETLSTRKDRDVFTQRRLRSRVIESKPISRPLECYLNCIKNCGCLSYNICNKGKLCELNSKKKENNVSLFEQSDDCDYYEYEFRKLQPSSACEDQCCATSNPCKNGWECHASCMTNNRRYQCACTEGNGGVQCEKKAKSCGDHRHDFNRAAGIRYVYVGDKKMAVYCYFDERRALTLVQSHDRKNINIGNTPLTKRKVIKKTTPNFVTYRLPIETMEHFRDNAKGWEITCSFDKNGYDEEKDILSGYISIFDPLKYNSGVLCQLVKKVRINGQGCDSCDVWVAQASSGVSMKSDQGIHCPNAQDVVPKTSCNGILPGYFANFKDSCFDEEQTCTSSNDATTQFWFVHED